MNGEDSAVRVPPDAVRVPLDVRVDAEHGGRWTSLHGGGREWLWCREELKRRQMVVGDAFVDAGGLEECVPTARGTPDHGDAWSRSWTALGDAGREHVVRCGDFELTRRISVADGAVVADYRLAAAPGYRFVWAGHALLDVSQQATLQLDRRARVRLPRGGTLPAGPVAAGRGLDRRELAGAVRAAAEPSGSGRRDGCRRGRVPTRHAGRSVGRERVGARGRRNRPAAHGT